MSDLYLNRNPVTSIFQLLGSNENDLTFSIAWVLSRCPTFLKRFLRTFLNNNETSDSIRIDIQKHEADGGITDIELTGLGRFHIIIEAKKGWVLPTVDQLQCYSNRESFKAARAKKKLIVTLTECNNEYSKIILPEKISGVPIKSITWRTIFQICEKSISRASNIEKRLLRELLRYLRRVITMQNKESNLVYVVSLGKHAPKNGRVSFIDIYEKHNIYFHPIGIKGWPKEPPNYLAVRYGGRLKGIHHIKGFEVTTNARKLMRRPGRKKLNPHFFYKLGKKITPQQVVKTGNIYPNGRVWCMLDTLLTSKTIAEARDITKKRRDNGDYE